MTAPVLGTAQAATAVTKLAFDELVLEDVSALRPVLLYQESFIDVVRKLQLHGHFHEQSDAELATHAVSLLAQHKPGPLETTAWSNIAAIQGELAGLDPKKLADLEKLADVAQRLALSLDDAQHARSMRVTALELAVDTHFAQTYQGTFASQLSGALRQGLGHYTHEIDRALALVREVVAYAEKASRGLVDEKRGLLATANRLRAWLGEPALDDTTDTLTLHDPLLLDVERIVFRTIESYDGPRSPGQWNLEAEQVNKDESTSEKITTLDDSRRVVAKNKAKKRKLDELSPSTPSRTREVLIDLIQHHADVWPTLTVDIGLTNASVASQIEFTAQATAALGYNDILGAGIAKLYETNIADVKKYLAWVQMQLSLTMVV